MIDYQTAPLRFELLARFDQLFPLPMNGPQLLLLFGGYAHQGQGILVTLDEAIQLQAERLGIKRVGFYPPVVLVQLLRTDHMTRDPERCELPLQTKTKPARFIDGVHCGSLLLQSRRPVQKRLLPEALRRLGIASAFLHHHGVKLLVHINPKLDHSSAAIKLAAGFLV